MISCKFEDGDPAQLRHIVSDGLIIRDNSILLVKRAEWLLEGGKYALPGGYMDLNETLHDCIVREALEETGWECTVKQFFGIVDNPGHDIRQNVSHVFILEPVKQVTNPDEETTHIEWFPLDKLPKEMAFDHKSIIQIYLNYLENGGNLPVFV